MTAAIFGAANFCGASGASYRFERMSIEQDWVRVAGVVLFAAPEGRSWRVIRVGGVRSPRPWPLTLLVPRVSLLRG